MAITTRQILGGKNDTVNGGKLGAKVPLPSTFDIKTADGDHLGWAAHTSDINRVCSRNSK